MRKGKFGGVGGGDNSRDIELSTSAGYIVWRYVGELDWINLFPIPSNGINGINGTNGTNGIDGKAVELSTSGGYIVWRYVGDITWNNICLVPANGTNGTNGMDGLDGVTPHIGINGNWYIGAVDTSIAATGPAGAAGQNGANGAAGRGIVSVLLTNTVGLVKTYTITYTDATTTTFDVTNGADGTGGGGGGTTVLVEGDDIEVYADFVDAVPFVYTCPFELRFLEVEYEGAAPTLSVALNTTMAKYADLTITPNGTGLVILKGRKETAFVWEVYIDFAIAGPETYKCPYPLKFTSMEHEQANAPALSVALNTNMAKYQLLTITADAAGLVSLTGIKL